MDLPVPPRCTIVSAYYRFPSKHSYSSYDEWMTNFLTTVDNEMVIFCDEESLPKLVKLRSKFKNKTYIKVVPLSQTYCGSPKFAEVWKRDYMRDVERNLHNPNLYIIWNQKSMFVKEAIELDPFKTDFFMWCDMGCFRTKKDLPLFCGEGGFPHPDFLKTAKRDKMYFLNIVPFEEKDFQLLPNGLTRSFEYVCRIGGTIFLGHRDMFLRWVELYYTYLDKYIQNDYFAGKDQNILATMYVIHPELFELVKPVQGEGDPWFYLQRYFQKAC